MKKQKQLAFTLIELLVVIALISIIILGTNNINFNKISDKQNLEGFFYKIKTNIETVSNNALIGKAINDSGLTVPKLWRIDFNSDYNGIGSGTIKTFYSLDGRSFINYQENNIISDKYYQIEISDNTNILNSTNGTGALIIEGGKLSLTGSTDKVLTIKTKYKNFEKIFTINTVSGVIEEE